jgi:TldD protein
MAPFSRRHFLIAAGLSAPALRVLAQDPYAEDVILRALKDELERSRQLRVVGGGGDETPYFISYTLDDADSFEVNANLGSITSVSRNRFRLPNIEVRVGGYDFDNTGHIYSGIYTGSRYDTEPFPLDDNYRAMRENLWLGTDHAYKAAVESIARKRAALTNAAAPAEKLADFSAAQPVENLPKVARTNFDEAAWKARMVRHSATFAAYPEILASGVEFHFNQDIAYYLNTEGVALRYQDDGAWVSARAEGQAPDGMVLRDALSTPVLTLAQIPSETELQDSLKALARNVQTLLQAPVGESFTGPALFEPAAAAQLLAQLLGENLRIPRKPISDPNRPVNMVASEFEGRTGSRVLPEWIDVIDDPTQTSYRGKPLAGYYQFDAEGVKAQAVPVIQKGVLKNFLTTRQPVKKELGSNGHARFPAGFGTRWAAIGNLFVKPAESTPLADLKTRLIQMCKERDKPYGLLIRKLDFPFVGSAAEIQTLQSGSANSGGSVRPVSPPILMYRVYPDGREELVRGMRFRGLSTRSLRDILAASTETTAFDYINNGAPLARSGVGGYVSLTSVISPGLLFDELEVDQLQNPLQRPALVPPPGRT